MRREGDGEAENTTGFGTIGQDLGFKRAVVSSGASADEQAVTTGEERANDDQEDTAGQSTNVPIGEPVAGATANEEVTEVVVTEEAVGAVEQPPAAEETGQPAAETTDLPAVSADPPATDSADAKKRTMKGSKHSAPEPESP